MFQILKYLQMKKMNLPSKSEMDKNLDDFKIR